MPLLPKPDAPHLVEDVTAAFWIDIGDNFTTTSTIAALGLPFLLWGLSVGSFEVAIFALLPLFIWLIYRYGKQQQLFMRQFGAMYGFSYEESRRPGGRFQCRLFNIGRGRNMTNILRGTYEERPIELFHYEYTTGSGKHKQTHYFTVCTIEFAGDLPDLVLEEKRFLGSDGLADRHHRALNLQGPFGEQFRAYVAEDLEIEAFEILTPDIMEFLIQKGGTYSFEFRNHRLFLVENGHLQNRRTLSSLIEFAGEIVDTLGPRLARLHDDVEAIKDAQTKSH